ncbi:xanthine dehydrogenase molybdopterin binding subunit [Dongia rigui]|uniref:Xanthine dehydrogenase molybdopterin binding subunit n=1 Tax=Dongia rigui TaxID=940149 RepID=A0ABU5DVR9_9PROT|nr:xanthine dehydrogenase molybdopterin binding subunit [Dongia rigui]MDY0871072.1 xanthine dehydrogenase molybdopterin binding subunit [Dongia rigui]
MADIGTARIHGSVGDALAHDSARKHVTGEALYIDDLPEPARCLHLVAGGAARAHARVVEMDLAAVRKAPGVVCVLTAADIPGVNDISPIHAHDDPLLCAGEVMFWGQPLFCVAAETRAAAQAAVRLARTVYEDLPAILSIDAALAEKSYVLEDQRLTKGNAAAAIASAPRRLSGRFRHGGQDHFYLEGQVSLVVPSEDGDVHIFCSTQHPTEVQMNVAQVLDRPANAVTVEVRRMGGGFGGKESQATQWAALAALAALKTGRPAKFRLDRDDDMVMTGKRHDFIIDWQVGFDEDGRIQGIDFVQSARAGFSADLSGAIADRAMFHADNAYYFPHASILSHRCKTHTVSNTAFRGFGGPQGMLGIEEVIDAIARELGRDPLDIRQVNFYGTDERNMTPYHMTVEDNIIDELVRRLEESSNYRHRRLVIAAQNAASSIVKRGLALTPVKFGISFTTSFLNQAGALLHIYNDGSVHLNHGGTEMGQGLFQKVAQVVAAELQIDLDRIKISATHTGKVPNTSATAASSGSDMNGKAAQAAAIILKERLIDFAARHFNVPAADVAFLPNRIRAGAEEITFDALVKLAYLDRVSLSTTGFYKTPKIDYDRKTARGRPFYYFAYGAAVSEVAVDTLTGEYRVTRVDILHDVGRSLNPAIDLGQIEGGFIQGMGWLTSEELWWDEKGQLKTHAPSTYKIPTASDRPPDFRVQLQDFAENREDAIHRSKAVGEPPLMLAISVFRALSDAIASVADYRYLPELAAPATPERVLAAIDALRERDA